ncbi:AraC family transcriptional regulator [marine bacterium AO1-C]|nr:AraC family transcriptional regulator [marine bacterium AO1-C]
MSEIIVHQTIAEFYCYVGLPIKQDIDFTIHYLPDIHKDLPYKSPIFRTEYFSFVFVKQGSGNYITDNHRFAFGNYTIYFTNPGHIKAFEIDTMSDAYIITFTESFLRENVHPDIFEEFPFLLAETVPPKQLNEEEFRETEGIYQQIFHHFHKDSPYKNRILGNLFVVMLLKIKERCWQLYNPLEEGDRNSQIVKTFKKLLARQFTGILKNPQEATLLQVQDFAEEMHLHPNYLSQVIKSKTGQSVHDWINKRTLATAKSLLRNTALSSKEVSYSLGFSEATHFSRFFKKQTGMTPTAYKKSLQLAHS